MTAGLLVPADTWAGAVGDAQKSPSSTTGRVAQESGPMPFFANALSARYAARPPARPARLASGPPERAGHA